MDADITRGFQERIVNNQLHRCNTALYRVKMGKNKKKKESNEHYEKQQRSNFTSRGGQSEPEPGEKTPRQNYHRGSRDQLSVRYHGGNNSRQQQKVRGHSVHKGRRGGHRQKQSGLVKPSGASSSSGSSTTSSPDTKAELEIPGFYYDQERKRYFKIQPGHSQGRFTQEKIKQKEKEEIRLKLLQDLGQSCVKAKLSASQRKVKRTSKNIIHQLDSLQVGCSNCRKHRQTVIHNQINRFVPVGKQPVFPDPANLYEHLEHMNIMKTNKDCTKLLCLWSLKGLIVQRIQMLKVGNLRPWRGPGNLDFQPGNVSLIHSFSKVTDLCWAPVSENSDEDYILYTTSSVMGNNPSLALLRRMDDQVSSAVNFRYTEFNLGNKVTWSCAWNRNTQQFSVGSEKCSLLIDVQTRRLWELKTKGSDVLTQDFCHKSGDMLISGTRRGHLLGHDLRSNSSFSTFSMLHKSSVCHLKVLDDDNYIIASDFNGHIRQWDLRTRQPVMTFKGHVNEYTRVPCYVNEEEQVLYGAGQDCYTRLWSMRDGQLLHTIPPPHPASRDTVPVLCYSSNLGANNYHGLLMGTHDEIRCYSTKL